MRSDEVVEFDELPKIEKLGLRHAWGVWGPDDQLGTVNFITGDAVVGASRLVERGVTFRLDLPITEPDPPLYGRQRLEHTVFSAGRNTWDDKLDRFFPQASTQWDSLRHVRCREYGFYGGVTEDPDQHARLGIDNWARRGIIGRGVLLDVARYRAERGTPIDPGEEMSLSDSLLDATAAAEGLTFAPGDIVCVRTGWMSEYKQRSDTARAAFLGNHDFPGLAADERMARFLWNNRVAAVVADNPTVEVSPGDPAVGSLHRRLIPLLGYALGELFVLDDLAEDCASRGKWEFMFSAAPLNLVGGVGSPGNAFALV